VITFVLLAVLAVIVLLVVLKVVVSIASAIFVPLLLITIGVAAGIWWARSRRR